MAQRTVFNPPTYSEAANAQQDQVRPDLQPAIQNFLAQQQITDARNHQSLADKLSQARLGIDQLKLDPELAHLKEQTRLAGAQADLAGRKQPGVRTAALPGAPTGLGDEVTSDEANAIMKKYEIDARAKTDADRAKKEKLVPSAEVAKIGQIRSLVNELQPVEEIFNRSLGKKGDSPYVGPMDARVQSGKQYTPLADADFATMKAKLSGVKNQILNMLSGAAISPKEYERLINALPDENRNEKDFAAKMTNFKQVQNDIINEKLTAFKQGGYDTAELEAGQSTRPEAGGGTAKKGAEARYSELLNSGMPEDQVYQKLAQEGF